ncbi:efflux RND transporter periplasmic adaptor subunit [Hyphomicrobium sp. CS1GBMeth3]|uniref:efflux RND transporter periplasmic adaptor subunit n=1 Tax=Hyphomicrobium sp. CS1GBMeth3 TaxID=1892845 RepID=UPI000931924D|nr:efflux RND transporter periplasmic adaptor subunit [Hyphomicrobium sp. CS1GBMeth3]
MRTITRSGATATLLLQCVVAGSHAMIGVAPSPAFAQGADHAGHDGKVLYWQHPDGKPDYSPTPKKTQDGRDFVPVHESAEKEITSKPSTAKAQPDGERKILYYRNPMGLPDTSPTPKKDWMGMDYIPVYKGEDQGGSSVVVSLDKVQRSGVRTEEARRRVLVRPIRAPAIAKPDERSMHVVALRADAFVEKLHVNETGKHVTKGEPLFRIYSPQMVTAQINYQVAARDRSGQGTAGAEQQLHNLQIPAEVLTRLRDTGEPVMSIDWPSPVTGVVMEKRVVEGQMARMGDELFRFADLTTIWVIADVAEQDLAAVSIGMPARIRFTALSNESYEGKVTFVLHELDASTRTGKVRIEVGNPDHRIKHEMYAEAEIDAGAGGTERVSVPTSSVIDSGSRQIVLVARGEGKFEPRAVKLGVKGEGYVEVLTGVAQGESVVVSANFLIDAESNLKAALSSFSGDAANDASKAEAPK